MKKVFLVAVVLLLAAPVFAQGPFTDVPTDHWAYDAVNQLQKDGILIGYPDGTFAGKRTITRFEFAVAIARVMQAHGGEAGGLTKADVEAMLAPYAKTTDIPTQQNLNNLATKDDVAAIRKLVDEFRDEIAALGVDVDALKRDVAALGARVDALDAMVKRVTWTGDVTAFAIAGSTTTPSAVGPAIDLDQRRLANNFMRNISFVKDFDLNVVGRVSQNTTANATIDYGNYLNYLAFVDDYTDGTRPVSKGFNGGYDPNTLSDNFFPYYLYINSGFGKGDLTVGRFPLQFTPYTLKMIDVDSYTSVLKTDDGNYPVDGAKLAINFGGVDITLFAAKHDSNNYLVNGLTAQPRAGLYDTNGPVALNGTVFHQGTLGHSVGGLNTATQSAGARFTVGTPCNGTLGGTFYQVWDRTAFALGVSDQARVFGGDLTIPLPVWDNRITFAGSWTRSDTLGVNGFADVDYGNVAWDGRFGFGIGSVDIGLGYKDIGRNFAAAGAWDKIGRWTNPTDVRGPYAQFAYPFSDNLKVWLNGEFLEAKDTVRNPGDGNRLILADDDEIAKAEAAVKWGFAKGTSLDVSYQWVKFMPTGVASLDPLYNKQTIESYLTVGVGHEVCPNAKVNVGYQFISYNGTLSTRPYYNDYRGGLGVIQLGVAF